MEHLDSKRKITIMIAIMAAMLFASLNQTIVGTALPKIISILGGMEYYSWVFTVYMLTSGITTILVGKLSDIYGRKPFLLLGIAVFIAGSFLTGTSTNIIQLIVYRGIQGIGGGMIMSCSFTAIGDLFAPRERGRWQGLMSASFGLASVFGPTLGGYIVDHMEWHWVFWVFLPFGIVALLMIWFMFPKAASKPGESVDYFGSLFLTLTIVPMLLAFTWAGSKYAWGSGVILSMFAFTIVALILFIVIENRVKNPVLPLFLFKNSIFTISNIIGFTIGAGMFGAIMYMPYFIQGVMGTSATNSGYVTMPMTLSLVAGSTVSGQIVSRTGKYKMLAFIGLAVLTAGMLLLSTMGRETTTLHAILYMIVVGVGIGLGMPIFTLTVQNAVDQKYLGVASASSQFVRSLGGTVGVAVMSTVMTHRMAGKMAELSAGAPANTTNIPADVGQKLAALQNPQVLLDSEKLSAIRNSLPAQYQTIFTGLLDRLREALSYSLSGVFLTGAIVVAAAIVLTFFLKEIPLRSGVKPNQPSEDEDGYAEPNEEDEAADVRLDRRERART
ncbi:MDR family MFS transporter [Paenibacillus contaminans]|uniref:MFS transporter n=1 Tax=Paenibacillus contaminans TaxID=450362 RepID=A0A329MH85_9BACL|nr:MDR family MFS transporter [Paenibacillus contaminans]RAV18978.1 MFS transporter [Paenibacillus contaminans]